MRLPHHKQKYIGAAFALLWVHSNAQTTTYVGPNKTNGDNWNNASHWDNGIPSGNLNVAIPEGKQVHTDQGTAVPYSGDLTMGDGSQLSIGWVNPRHAADANALGTPGVTTVNTGDGVTIVGRLGTGSPVFPALALNGDLLFISNTSTEPPVNWEFAHGISGTGTLTIQGKGNKFVNFSAPGTFDEIIFKNTEGSFDSFITAAGALNGNVTIESRDGTNPDVDLSINAADAISDSATLALNGANTATLITMNSDDTVSSLTVNGSSFPAGTYGGLTSTADQPVSWIGGTGILTVSNAPSDATPPTDPVITDNSVNGVIFFSAQSLTYTVTFNEPITTSVTTEDFEVTGSASGGATIDSVTQTNFDEVQVVVTAASAGTLTLGVKASASFDDLYGNTVSGPFTDTDAITIRDIADLEGQLGILDLSANGGVNPATGNLWQVGDNYRFIFASSTGRDATSADITDYNTFIQNLADASGLGLSSASWKALVSTAGDGGDIPAVAANVNTGTDTGSGESIWLLNGTSLVADNYSDLYGSWTHSSPITVSETGGTPFDAGSYGSVWTGSNSSGGILSNEALGAADGTSRTGLKGSISGAHWINRFSIDQSTVFGMYGMSEVLTIQAVLPEIAIEQDSFDIANGGSKDFGAVAIGSNNSLVFTLLNIGNAQLNLTGTPLVAVSGDHSSDFTVTAAPSTPLEQASSTTFTVQFAPSVSGVRNALLTIENDDGDESPFTINLSGTGTGSQSAYQAWATGNEAFDGDANGDGISNGMAFLMGAADPSADARGLMPAMTNTAEGLQLSFTMLDSASRGDATLNLMHSADLGTWTEVAIPESDAVTDGVTFTITGTGTLNVTATIAHSHAVDGKLFGRVEANE